MTKIERLNVCNELIKVIASCGRQFFKNKNDGFVSYLELSKNGRLYFIDYYTKKRIYTHKEGRWDGFTSGGTLKCLIESLRDFIMDGHALNANYFYVDYFDDNDNLLIHNPWGYGKYILIVRYAIIRLGIGV